MLRRPLFGITLLLCTYVQGQVCTAPTLTLRPTGRGSVTGGRERFGSSEKNDKKPAPQPDNELDAADIGTPD